MPFVTNFGSPDFGVHTTERGLGDPTKKIVRHAKNATRSQQMKRFSRAPKRYWADRANPNPSVPCGVPSSVVVLEKQWDPTLLWLPNEMSLGGLDSESNCVKWMFTDHDHHDWAFSVGLGGLRWAAWNGKSCRLGESVQERAFPCISRCEPERMRRVLDFVLLHLTTNLC